MSVKGANSANNAVFNVERPSEKPILDGPGPSVPTVPQVKHLTVKVRYSWLL